MVDIYVKLAEDAVEKWVLEGQRRIEFSDYESLPSELTERQRGVFVSLKTTEGKLRGCIGTYHPVEENVAREIVRNSVLAASRDPRFPSLSPPDLKKITVSVDVLSEPECCKIDDLNPKQYGIVVEKGGKEGLLLPDLDGVD
ncbi:MAG: AmmeMemoRadiSam system protein A, partial [Candidatus Bipolaricaulota bacterium]